MFKSKFVCFDGNGVTSALIELVSKLPEDTSVYVFNPLTYAQICLNCPKHKVMLLTLSNLDHLKRCKGNTIVVLPDYIYDSITGDTIVSYCNSNVWIVGAPNKPIDSSLCVTIVNGSINTICEKVEENCLC